MLVNENGVLTFNGKISKKVLEGSENLVEISVLSMTQDHRITAQASALIVFEQK
ncbi:MAG: hypothetical protein ACFFE4_10370 [Candidatus Thorarchaeota archaeon]